jgi:hypothetical protein
MTPTATLPCPAGYTVADVANRYRVGDDKVRGWIRSGALRAINTAGKLCARPRFVVMPEALAEFETGRHAGPPPKPERRRRPAAMVDFYPD